MQSSQYLHIGVHKQERVMMQNFSRKSSNVLLRIAQLFLSQAMCGICVFNAASKDGTVIGLFHEAQVMIQLPGGEGGQFYLRQFNWLGS